MRGHRVRLVQAASSHIPGKPHARSAVTNGAVLLADVDGRSTWARRARDLINEHLGDIGGLDQTSAAERSLVRRASVIEVELERLETSSPSLIKPQPMISISTCVRPVISGGCWKLWGYSVEPRT